MLNHKRCGQLQASIPVLLTVVSFSVFLSCPVAYMSEGALSLLTAESLVTRGQWHLDNYHNLPDGGQTTWPGFNADGHRFYFNPPGTVILATPAVTVSNCFGWTCIGPDDQWLPDRELWLQRIMAAGLSAVTVALFYLIARTFLSWWPSIVVAIAAGFGTQVFSTCSRALWSQTWLLLLMTLSLLLLLQKRWFWLAIVLSVAFFCRPTAVVPIVCVSGYVFWCDRKSFGPYALIGLCLFGAFISWSYWMYDTPVPSYYDQLLPEDDIEGDTRTFAIERIARDLLSPSRGLLICVPVSFIAFYLGMFHRREHRPLFLLAVAVIVLHFVMLGCHRAGPGFCFGARYTADLVPWLALLAILGLAGRGSFSPVVKCCGVLLLAVSIAINTVGACSVSTLDWQRTPVLSEKCWAWFNPQWLAWFW